MCRVVLYGRKKRERERGRRKGFSKRCSIIFDILSFAIEKFFDLNKRQIYGCTRLIKI